MKKIILSVSLIIITNILFCGCENSSAKMNSEINTNSICTGKCEAKSASTDLSCNLTAAYSF